MSYKFYARFLRKFFSNIYCYNIYCYDAYCYNGDSHVNSSKKLCSSNESLEIRAENLDIDINMGIQL